MVSMFVNGESVGVARPQVTDITIFSDAKYQNFRSLMYLV
jgi:hypothetical protein